MTEHPHHEKGTLVLALLAGLSVNGSFTTVFSAVVPFSLFPLIAFVLSIYCLHHRYSHLAMPDGMPLLVSASFLVGILLYSALVRVEYPQMGSNFLPSLLCVALVLWIVVKLRKRRPVENVPTP